jgi:hypothetical protein
MISFGYSLRVDGNLAEAAAVGGGDTRTDTGSEGGGRGVADRASCWMYALNEWSMCGRKRGLQVTAMVVAEPWLQPLPAKVEPVLRISVSQISWTQKADQTYTVRL